MAGWEWSGPLPGIIVSRKRFVDLVRIRTASNRARDWESDRRATDETAAASERKQVA